MSVCVSVDIIKQECVVEVLIANGIYLALVLLLFVVVANGMLRYDIHTCGTSFVSFWFR